MISNRRHRIDAADESGQTLTEYGLLVALLAVAAVAAVPTVQSTLVGLYTSAGAAFGS